MHYAIGGTIKALGNGKVGGYLVRFTDASAPDLTGEYFTPDTDFGLDSWSIDGKPVLYHHGLDDTLRARAIGQITATKADDVGLWVEAQLAMRDEYEQKIYELAQAGKLGWSSGALPQTVQVEQDGRIKSWVIVEGSLTPTPAEPQNSVIPLKALMSEGASGLISDADATKTTIPIEGDTKMDASSIREALMSIIAMLGEDEAMAMDEPAVLAEMEKTAADMPLEEQKSLTAAQVTALAEAAIKASNARRKVLADGIKAAKAANAPAEYKSVPHIPAAQIAMRDLRYDHLSASDVGMGIALLQSKGMGVSGRMLQVMHAKSAAIADDPKISWESRSAMKATIEAYRGDGAMKANELDTSITAGQALEWTGIAYSNMLWEKVREPRTVLGKLREMGAYEQPMGQGEVSTYIPLESTDPIFYTGAQSADADATGRPPVGTAITPFASGRVLLTPGELRGITFYTDNLDEDSVISIAPQVNRQMSLAIEETLERLVVNGDTATAANTNINLIDGTPATGTTTPYYIATNGLRKYPLVTNTAVSLNVGAVAPTLATFMALFNLYAAEFQSRKDRMFYLMDRSTHNAVLQLPEILTADVSRAYTIQTGDLPPIYGIGSLATGFLPLSNTAGKVSGTPGNNVRGTLALIYAPYWGYAFKRQITIESFRDPREFGTSVVASLRFGMVPRGAGAATLGYNILVS